MAVVTCACRDCFELTYAAETVNSPTCEIYPQGFNSEHSIVWECQREYAYDAREYQ